MTDLASPCSGHDPASDKSVEVSRGLSGLISPLELHSLVASDPNVIIIDVSTTDQFLESHIEAPDGTVVGAPQFFDYLLDEGVDGCVELARYFTDLLVSLGVDSSKTVVLTEAQPDAGLGKSARAELILKVLNFLEDGQLFVLDGGNANWVANNLPVDSGEAPERSPTQKLHTAFFDGTIIATRNEVVDVVNWRSPGTVILDVRDFEEFAGEMSSPGNVRPDTRCGRIPGSLHLEWGEFLVEDPEHPLSSGGVPVVASAERAREVIEPLGLDQNTPIILYCFKGSRAAFVHKVLTDVLSFTDVRVYFESWVGYSAQDDVPIEQGLPSSTRAFGHSRSFVKAFHKHGGVSYPKYEAEPSSGEGGYESVTAERVDAIAEQHAWITEPLFRASEQVLHSPFYQWLAALSTPQEFKAAAMHLWHHSATFPPVLAKRLAHTGVPNRRMFQQFGEHAYEESTHNQLLLDWMTTHELISDPSEVENFLPSIETNACVNIGHNLATDPDLEKWIVTMNCGIERCSWHFFNIVAPRMHELRAGHEYFDVHVQADPYHSVLGLEDVKVYSPDDPRGKYLVKCALEGVTLWAAMVNSWIGVDYTPKFDLAGSLRPGDRIRPLSWQPREGSIGRLTSWDHG